MQLMRAMYHLGELQAWEALLPSTKQRLREASKAASLSEDDSRAFWCVVGTLSIVKHCCPIAVHIASNSTVAGFRGLAIEGPRSFGSCMYVYLKISQ